MPTEPGWYWAREQFEDWKPVQVVGLRDRLVYESECHSEQSGTWTMPHDVDDGHYEWGPKIEGKPDA